MWIWEGGSVWIWEGALALCGPGRGLCVGLGGALCLKRYKFRDVMLAHIVCIYDGMVYTYTVELIKPASTLATKKPYILYAYSE